METFWLIVSKLVLKLNNYQQQLGFLAYIISKKINDYQSLSCQLI